MDRFRCTRINRNTKNFLKKSNSYKMISKSMLDYSWIDDVKIIIFNSKSDILFIIEGVLCILMSVMTQLLDTIIKKDGRS